MNQNQIKIYNDTPSKEQLITRCGEHLLELGSITDKYIAGMLKREELVSTFVGNHVAVPHGVDEVRTEILKTEIVLHVYPDGVDFGNENIVYVAFGLAAIGDEHLNILSDIAIKCSDIDFVMQLKNLKTIEEMSSMLGEI